MRDLRVAFGEELFERGPDVFLVVDLDQDNTGVGAERLLISLAQRGKSEGGLPTVAADLAVADQVA